MGRRTRARFARVWATERPGRSPGFQEFALAVSDIGLLLLFFALGVAMLVAEIFIPSHGVLTLAGLAFITAGVVKTFSYGGKEAGTLAVLACLIVLPTFAGLAVKYWQRTPIGRRIAPPNRVATVADSGVPVQELRGLVGAEGRSVSALRPVGICDFGGRRMSCVAEAGLIDSGVPVVAVGISGANLTVAPKIV